MKIQEPPLKDLDPKVRQLIEKYIPHDESILMCCQCIDSGLLIGQLFTERQAIKAVIRKGAI